MTDMGTASLSASMTDEMKITSNTKADSVDLVQLISEIDAPKELVEEDLDAEVRMYILLTAQVSTYD